MNRLEHAISPYLRSHADNPVDWFAWGPEAFAEAERRDVPVLVSIGYSTCHWCHVMARESFSDPTLAAELNSRFVAIKVDREEHPEVDSVYLAAAGAFTQGLGWPLNVFVTPQGRAFFAATYSPPVPIQGHPSFIQVLDAVDDAWRSRRDQVDLTAAAISDALTQAAPATSHGAIPADAEARLDAAVRELEGYEDTEFGGFGGAPKFPVAPVLSLLLRRRSPLAPRTLLAMSRSPLRDEIEGGFFRYSVNRDWSDPHYERMLYDNALLLDAYARLASSRDVSDAEAIEARTTTEGIASFLTTVLQQPEGGFGSAQDSESTLAGSRNEGGYYALDAAARAAETPPAVDAKILTGWNGFAIAALSRAGFALDRRDWIAAAARAADFLLESHVAADGTLVRASIGSRRSDAAATLEDYGAFAGGLLALAAVSGRVEYAVRARRFVDAVLDAGFTAPGGRDAVLAAQNIASVADTSEGAYPSGVSAVCDAAVTLFDLTGEARYRDVASGVIGGVASEAFVRPIGYGATLELVHRLIDPIVQLVVVTSTTDAEASANLVDAARSNPTSTTVIVTESEARAWTDAGFELLEGRTTLSGHGAAYLCTDFVCRLPVVDAGELEFALRSV
ncbi:thioredoxin domain-containing protein [Agreia sp.]|uniref:thioredoxin domain-containing protein n=1 Tax=Agreia sp. TaxID=1872416 RepID=UPI0035BC5F43